MFIFPHESASWVSPAHKSDEALIRNMQETAEKALNRELPKYSPSVRKHVEQELREQCGMAGESNAKQCQVTLNRLLQVDSSLAVNVGWRKEAEGGRQGNPSMKQQRERQRHLAV